MKDYLNDLIAHTHGLGVIDTVKVTGSDKETSIDAISEDKSVIVYGTFKHPCDQLIGTFGMPNLSKLKTILGFDDYDQESKVSMVRDQQDQTPRTIHFETKNKDFVNDYRLMSKSIVEEKVKRVQFKGATWNIEFEPSIAGIMRLKKQASANSEELHFTVKVENNDLRMMFGDPGTHYGNFVFHQGVQGKLTRPLMWPVKVFVAILDLPGDKTIKISDQGVLEISVDSGLAVYRYLLPAHAK